MSKPKGMLRLALTLALASLALPVGASATTVTPTGAVTGEGVAVFDFDLGSLTCASHFTGDISNATTPSSGTLDTLTFTGCTGAFGVTCIVTVNAGGLPRGITVVYGSPPRMNISGTIAMTIDCDSNSSDCTVSVTNLAGTICVPSSTVRFDVTLSVNQSGGNCTSPPGLTATYALTIAGTASETATGAFSITP